MNYMKKQQISKLQHLADLVGDFIRYWGFRKIHGEIWTVVYLSNEPLSGADVVKLLKVSKALVSPALKELEHEGLILPAESENSKTKRYKAEENISKIIRGVLCRREKPMMNKILSSYLKLQAEVPSDAAINDVRFQKLGGLIQRAQLALLMLSDSDEMWN